MIILGQHNICWQSRPRHCWLVHLGCCAAHLAERILRRESACHVNDDEPRLLFGSRDLSVGRLIDDVGDGQADAASTPQLGIELGFRASLRGCRILHANGEDTPSAKYRSGGCELTPLDGVSPDDALHHVSKLLSCPGRSCP